IARLNADGSIDSSFGDNGHKVIHLTVGGTDIANSIAVLDNGKILLAGAAGTSPRAPAFVQLNPDGTLDSSFGFNGIMVVENLGFDSYALDMKIQKDGKIVSNLVRINVIPRPFTVI